MDSRPPLRTIFGFDDFRPGQEAAAKAALADRDALVVMPTGSGKSLCYQALLPYYQALLPYFGDVAGADGDGVCCDVCESVAVAA